MSRGRYQMSQKELQRLPVIEAVLAKQMTQLEAAECLDLSTRQVRRLERRVQAEGPCGLMHRSCGQPAHHRFAEGLQQRVLGLIRQKYSDFGPTLASEKLAEAEKIRLSDETLRQWMRAEGMVNGRRRSRPNRQWRQRSACLGQMVQMDGSHHRWLEKRGGEFVLMGYVDDATGRVYARFYPSEDREAAFDSFKRYCRLYGIPQSVYLDKHSIYKSVGKPTVEEELANRWPQTQFERALGELGVTVIHAHSPQAKGRVERLFKTLQDRLVKELRLAGIRGLEEANQLLRGFLVRYNRRFSRAAREPGNVHRPVPAGMRLDEVLCEQEPRIVANDGTIRIRNQRLQLLSGGLRPLARKGVVVTISPKGRLGVRYEGRLLCYKVLPAPVPAKAEPQSEFLPRQMGGPGYKPVEDHPWRQFQFGRGVRIQPKPKVLKLLKTASL